MNREAVISKAKELEPLLHDEHVDCYEFTRRLLRLVVPSEFNHKIDAFVDFLVTLYKHWIDADRKVKLATKRAIGFLYSKSLKPNTISAKLYAFYAYLVFIDAISPSYLLHRGCIKTSYQIYKWIRIFRTILHNRLYA